MPSRDTIAHVLAVVVAFLLLFAAAAQDIGTGSLAEPASLALFVVFYGLIFGGSHLYLALRGEDGMVPVESRWRFVGALGTVLALGVVIAVAGGRMVGSVSVQSVGLTLAALVGLGYLVLEARAGYRGTYSES